MSVLYISTSTFAEDDHRNYNRYGAAFDVGETFAGLDYGAGLEFGTDHAGYPYTTEVPPQTREALIRDLV